MSDSRKSRMRHHIGGILIVNSHEYHPLHSRISDLKANFTMPESNKTLEKCAEAARNYIYLIFGFIMTIALKKWSDATKNKGVIDQMTRRIIENIRSNKWHRSVVLYF